MFRIINVELKRKLKGKLRKRNVELKRKSLIK